MTQLESILLLLNKILYFQNFVFFHPGSWLEEGNERISVVSPRLLLPYPLLDVIGNADF